MMILAVPEMLLESGLDVACSSISAGETNASIDWYFTVVTLGERKSSRDYFLDIIFAHKQSNDTLSNGSTTGPGSPWDHLSFLLWSTFCLGKRAIYASKGGKRSISQPIWAYDDASGLNVKWLFLFHCTRSTPREWTDQAAFRLWLQSVKRPGGGTPDPNLRQV